MQVKIINDDVQSDAWNLFRLIDTIYDQVLEMDFGPVGNRNAQLDRVCSLLAIARDTASNTAQKIDTDINELLRCAE